MPTSFYSVAGAVRYYRHICHLIRVYYRPRACVFVVQPSTDYVFLPWWSQFNSYPLVLKFCVRCVYMNLYGAKLLCHFRNQKKRKQLLNKGTWLERTHVCSESHSDVPCQCRARLSNAASVAPNVATIVGNPVAINEAVSSPAAMSIVSSAALNAVQA